MKDRLCFKLLPALVLFLTGGCFFFKTDKTAPELAQMGFRASSDEPGILLHPKGTLKLTPEKRTCYINGMQFFLPNAVQLDEEERCRLTPLSLEKVIRPLFSDAQVPYPVKTVILDPGHGKDDFGARGKKFNEKDLNLSLAREIAEALKKRGINVRMTRMDDTFLTLDQRGKMANKNNGDIFLSIHHNASLNNKSCGVETYIATPAGSASTNDKEEQIHTKPAAGCQYDQVNIILASRIQKNMVRATGSADRGVRFARFRVLALSQLPGALIEAGFVSNPAEELQCANTDRQRKIAEAIADAVASL